MALIHKFMQGGEYYVVDVNSGSVHIVDDLIYNMIDNDNKLSSKESLIEKLKDKITNLDEIKAYQTAASLKSDFERSELNKDKTGVEIKGIKAINPATGKEIPIWVSDYVLITYGTGAIMAVPAHDERDYAFATKFGLDIVPVIEGGDVSKEAYSGDGVHINSDFLNGMEVADAKKKMIEYLEEKHIGRGKTNFK